MLRSPQGLAAAQSPDEGGVTPLQLAARQGSGRMAAVMEAAGLKALARYMEL